MSLPRIAVSCYPRNDQGHFTLPARYLECIGRAHGIGLVVTPVSASPQELMHQFDGFVLTGGADIDPALYGGQMHASIYGLDPERDAFELEMARQLAASGIPLMAICRGVQVLNVALGGTLVEHVPDEYGNSVIHRSEDFDQVQHTVTLQADSTLARLIGAAQFSCASFHHQSIRQLAPGFRVAGTAADGVIEAIESVQYPQIIGVQWHPEFTASEDHLQQGLFDAFVELARQYASASKV